MTPRDRLLAAFRGEEVRPKPIITWPRGDYASSDAVIHRDPSRIAPDDNSRLVLVEIASPFQVCRLAGISILDELETNPVVGNGHLQAAVESARREIDLSLAAGADGILYCLHGATLAHMSPMSYGGHFLERDRELLSAYSSRAQIILFVAGGEGTYFDFVSDLPASAFAWDANSSMITASEMRSIRAGALASADPSSDIIIDPPTPRITDLLESSSVESAV
jgi:hypothetical protein